MAMGMELTHFANRARQCFFCGPAITKPLTDCFDSYSRPARPLGDHKIFAVEQYKDIVAPIGLLLFHRCPSAITWLVITVWIRETINRMLTGRPLAHVGKKILECVPSFAHSDSPSSVLMKSLYVRVFASLADINPRMVFGCMGKSVSCIAVNANLAMNVDV